MNTIKSLLLIIAIVYSFDVFSQDYQEVNYPVKAYGSDLDYAFLGGLTNPQFSSVDFNQDGVQDLVAFDQQGDRLYTFLHSGEPNSTRYIYAPEYETAFPRIYNWMLMRDYNGDGVQDIFTGLLGTNLVTIFTGSIDDNGNWAFEKKLFPDNPLDGLYYDFQSVSGNILRLDLYVAFNTDIPIIDDIDGDGDLDILSFESGGSFLFYYKNNSVENGRPLEDIDFEVGDRCWGKFQEGGQDATIEISDDPSKCFGAQLHDNEIISSDRHSGSAVLSFDNDGDGNFEILIGDIGASTMTLVKNDGTNEAPYVSEVIKKYPAYDTPIDIHIAPAAYYLDVDNDGVRDLLASSTQKESGVNKDHIWFYKNVAASNQPPDFELSNRNFLMEESINIGRYTHPIFFDHNADGLMDILVGSSGLRSTANDREIGLYLFENIGTESNPSFELIDDDYLGFSELIEFSQRLSPAVGDLNGDGAIDLLVGDSAGKLYYFPNQSAPGQPVQYTGYIYDWMDIDVGQNANPQIFDFNKDGLNDLIIGENNSGQNVETGVKGNLNYFQNIGTLESPMYNADIKAEGNSDILGMFDFPGSRDIAPLFYDTEDGETILFAGTNGGDIVLFDDVNSVDEPFNIKESQLGDIRIGNNTVPALYDIDADGYLEMLLGNRRGGLDFYKTPFLVSGIDTDTDNIPLFDWSISPNPARDLLIVRSEVEIKNINILNITGQIINSVKDNFDSIDIGFLRPGFYLIEIQSTDDIYATKKIVVID